MSVIVRDEFIAELRAMHNDICIVHDHELVRLIGFHEDEIDYYYHVRRLDGVEYMASAVGACESLKGVYPRYDQLENGCHMNRCKRETEFLVTAATAD